MIEHVGHMRLRWQNIPAEPINGGIDARFILSFQDRLEVDLPSDTIWFDAAHAWRRLRRGWAPINGA